MKFNELPLDYELLDGIDALNFTNLTPIQEQAIPPALEGKDLIACAQTGTGKTAAYLIPVIQHLRQYDEADHTRVLIIAPTRELVKQIDQNVDALSYFTGVSSIPIIGGKNADNFARQKYGITHGADIIIATPGRLLIHLTLGYLDMSHIDIIVLDEADKMLDMGFHADITRIIGEIPDEKELQILMFSATMPPKIRQLAKDIMNTPVEINLNISKPAAGINQMVYMCYDEQKIPLLEHLLKEKEIDSMIIFASSKLSVDQIERKLSRLKYDVKAIHSDREQEEREETLRGFKNKQFKILVGTDVLARGIDVDNLSHVLNYDAPRDAEDYVHRVGRTARASSKGEAITFVNPRDQRKLYDIENLIGDDIPKPEPPKEIGETPRYNPSKRSGGGSGRGRFDRNKKKKNYHKSKGGGSSHRKSDDRNRNNKNRSGGSRNLQSKNRTENKPIVEGAAKKKKRRYRPRPKKNNTDKKED